VVKISKEKRRMIKKWLQLQFHYGQLTCPFFEKKTKTDIYALSGTFYDTYCSGTCGVMFPEVIKLVKARANKDGYPKGSCPCFHLPVRTVIKRAKALIGKD